MFFIDRKVKVKFLFEPYEMNLLSSDSDPEILKRVKERVEARCHEKYGFIIQVTTWGIVVSPPKIKAEGIQFTVTFSAIIFKPEKNDIMDIFVSKLSQDTIVGNIGSVEVMIPRTRMPQDRCTFFAEREVYLFRDFSTGEELTIQNSSRVRCKCYEVKIEFNSHMKIIAFIDDNLVSSTINRAGRT